MLADTSLREIISIPETEVNTRDRGQYQRYRSIPGTKATTRDRRSIPGTEG